MSKPNLPRPTDAELSILRILWERGPSTVREIHEASDKSTGYTTYLKLLQIMADKGLVLRDDSQRTHVFRARCRAEETQQQLVSDLMNRAFGGSAKQLVMQALSTQKATPEEMAEIHKLLNRLSGGEK